jgi:hypothetical protein
MNIGVMCYYGFVSVIEAPSFCLAVLYEAKSTEYGASKETPCNFKSVNICFGVVLLMAPVHLFKMVAPLS